MIMVVVTMMVRMRMIMMMTTMMAHKEGTRRMRRGDK
jgi:hypothetical protein